MEIGSIRWPPTLGEKQIRKCDVKITSFIAYGYVFGVK